MIKNRLCYLAGLAVALLFHAFYFGWFSWFVLMTVILLPLFSLLVSIPAMAQMELSLELPQRTRQGGRIYLGLRGSSGRFPMPKCRFRLTVTNCLSGQSISVGQTLPAGGRWYLNPDTTHCGQVTCAVTKGRVYDYLGLFSVPLRHKPSASVLVCPVAEEPRELPNLNRFLNRRSRPKPGGGFAEEHELREYRPGDPLRQVHWKLSVKTDSLILREAQEPVRERTLLTLDLRGTPHGLDRILSNLVWLSRWLLEHDTVHGIAWTDPADGLVQAEVTCPEDLTAVLDKLLCSTPDEGLPSLAHRRFPGVSWRYHLMEEDLP